MSVRSLTISVALVTILCLLALCVQVGEVAALRRSSIRKSSVKFDATNPSVCGKRLVKPPGRRSLREVDYHADETADEASSYEDQDDYTPGLLAATRPATRVHGGKDTYPGEFPWFVIVESKFGEREYAFCGGVILHKNMVLTAAHCIIDETGEEVEQIKLFSGITNIREQDNAQYVYGEEFFVDDEFHYDWLEKGDDISRDYALIRTNETFLYDKYTQPICIGDKQSRVKESPDCVFAGRGITYEGAEKESEKLQKLEMKLCPARDGSGIKNRRDELCYTYNDRYGKGRLCMGDSGSSMICAENTSQGERFYTTGVFSSTRGRCELNPGPIRSNFVDIARYRQIIEDLADEWAKMAV